MIKKNYVLLAEPYLDDPNFKRAAIALVDHHKDGVVGFVLNNPTEGFLHQYIEDIPIWSRPIGLGGPVDLSSLHFLHTLGDILDESIPVTDNLFWGGNFDQLIELIRDKIVTEKDVRFFQGYSGWAPGQLDMELEGGTWVVGQLTNDLIFNTPHDQVWPKAIRRLGNSYLVIGDMDDESPN